MKQWILLALLATLSISASAHCKSDTGKPTPEAQLSPEEVIERLWKSAAAGDLLTAEGWDKTVRGLAADYPFRHRATP
jgi:hypothetical protein